MPFCIAVAVRDMNFTPAQALWAATAGGAAALRRDDVGVLAVGRRADFVRLDAPSYLHLAYRPGVPLVRDVVEGRPAHGLSLPESGVTIVSIETVVVGIGPVSFDEVVRVARDGAAVALSDESLDAIAKSRARIEELAHDPKPVYGVSTGFGALATRHIPHELRTQLQRSLIRSHAAGSGPEVEREVVRAMMLLRLSTLATGRTGVRPEVAQTYAAMLSAGLTPVVYEYGSLGCSGDLAPLAHVALAAIGEGSVRTADGELLPSAEALARHGIEPVVLAEKEGLALINGTDGMLGMLVLALRDLDRLLKLADVAAAMSVEGLLGSDRVFAEDLQAMRPHPGQAAAAANMRRVLAESPIVASHSGPDCALVQDAYSLRCAPQVAGAARDTVEHARTVAGRELASAVDNPVVTLDGRVESNGNFHGAPVGLRARLPRHRSGRSGEHQRAAHRPVPRCRPQPRPQPVPRRRSRRGQRAHDRPVHAGRDRLRTQAAGQPGQRRLDPVVGDAGRSRLHGVVGGAQAAQGHRRTDPSAGDRGVHRGARYRDARPAGSVACHRGRHRRDPGIRPGARHRPVPVAGDRRRRRAGCLGRAGDGRRIGHRPVGLRGLQRRVENLIDGVADGTGKRAIVNVLQTG